MSGLSSTGIRIAIDRGGTFCDFWATIPGKEDDVVFKLLSNDPNEYDDAPIEGIRKILEIASNAEIPRGTPLDISNVESIRMGTTVATNALLERKGERVALLITKGFKDLLIIGNQARPSIFDLSVAKLGRLYEKVIEVDERVTIEGFAEDPEPEPIDIVSNPDLVEGLTGEAIRILKKPDTDAIRRNLQALWDEGYRTLALALMHSFAYPAHEAAIATIAREMGFKISVSSELQPMIKLVPRAQSATADAYLSPVVAEYLNGFRQGFKGSLEDENAKKLLLCQSDGGLTAFDRFTGLRAILSGPAAGVIGCVKTCYDPQEGTPVLGFDMGGTSTDVSRYNGSLDHVLETTIAQVALQSPQLDVHTVAAGGGSILFWRNGLFAVGPESAGAYPGPACYGNGGPLTITDANFLLGRILPDYFARPLDTTVVQMKFLELTETVNAEKKSSDKLTPEQVAMGFLMVANAAMARPIRALSEGRGFETAAHHLVCFGGAGGQHATAIARDLGIQRVLIHRLSSILSAYGLALADVVVETQEPEASVYSADSATRLEKRFDQLEHRASGQLASEGFGKDQIKHERFLNMRYKGSDTALMIPSPETSSESFSDAFVAQHQTLFGFTQPREILVDDVRVRSVGKSMEVKVTSPFEEMKAMEQKRNADLKPAHTRDVYFEGTEWTSSGIYHLKDIPKGSVILGPAMIIDETQTIVVDPASEATILKEHVVINLLDSETKGVNATEVDPVQLSVFGHRFMSVAEQMGETMRKTSISTNIKERLDYSCAIFSSGGRLVANAPHIPGHLGSMSYAIAYQAKLYGPGELKPGDVILSNHPISGGTHLPDLTVTTPVFDEKDPTKILFFVANRGHHADIGGIAAGSMPPNSTALWQEGAAVESFKMVKEGVFDEEGLIYHLYDAPGSYPGCSGTRTLKDNIADLKAGIAANHRGIQLIQSLIREYSWPVVQLYMEAIQKNAEDTVRTLLKDFSRRFQGYPLEAVDYMDDGSPLALKITINPADGSAKFDFSGTGPQALNNLNAPPAIMYSGIMYCLRSMISADIPLNQGCLNPIELIFPPNSILSPDKTAATVGSNVETSQRVVDVILKAFRVSGASQGTCNNLTFGYGGTDENGIVTKGFGYYETIAGGAGAGANWDGQDGVHTHITNTRMTDPETLEKRYPVLLREFSIRRGSGGAGRHRGGDGCVRDIELRRPMQVSILSERRVIPPYGMAGGEDGTRGVNLWVRNDPVTGTRQTISIGSKASVAMETGDRIVIQTPGGGGYGVSEEMKRKVEVLGEFMMDKPGIY